MNSKKLLAIFVCVIIALFATYLGGVQKVVGAPMIGLLISMIIVNFMKSIDKDFKSGTTFAGKKFLNLGIILTGATLNFTKVLGIGAKALPMLLINICVAFAAAYLIGKKLSLSSNTSTLVASGTSICGGTAIATIASIIKAKESEIAYAMAAIFLFDLFAALSYPYLADILSLTTNQFGFLAGAAINDTSSVVAAESTYNVLNGIDSNLAITVKLARTTLLILLVVTFTVITIKNESRSSNNEKTSMGKAIAKSFPKFIIAFIVMAILNTMGIFDGISSASTFFSKASKFFITTALAGVGFKIQFKDLLTKGIKPIILGGCTWFAVFASSIIFITIFSEYIG